jgi:hypothetical protein
MTAPAGYVQLRNRMVRLFRSRAVEALHNAKLAREAGDMDGMRSCLIAVRFWRRHAERWARKVVS